MRLSLVLIPLLAIGCAGGAKRHASVKPYIKTIVPVGAKQWHTTYCPQSAKKLKGRKWETLLENANACLKKSKWKMVEVIAKRLSQKEFYSPWGAYYLSLVSERKGNLMQARWMIELAMKKAPEIGLIRYQRARLFWKAGEELLAVKEFETALKEDESLLDARRFLGQIYLRDQDCGAATEYFMAVLKERPSDSVAQAGVRQCKKRLSGQSISEYGRLANRTNSSMGRGQ